MNIDTADSTDEQPKPQEDRLWCDNGWTAKVVKNDSDDGWAVEMIKDGEPEPALVGPWTMGRNKKDPKPLDSNAFITLVKTATEFVRRHEQQLHATLHQSINVTAKNQMFVVELDIVPDEDEPHAMLAAYNDGDAGGTAIAHVKVAANFKLSRASAIAWVENDFKKPKSGFN